MSRARRAPKTLTADTGVIEVNGKAATVFRLLGPDGRAGLSLTPGERFHTELVNRTGVATIVHWHGQTPPWTQDGVPWPQTPAIRPGATAIYDYAPVPGTYWMHSHEGLQLQNLLAAPLIVHDADELREDRREVTLLLNDFSFRSPEAILAGLTGMTVQRARGMEDRTENAPPPPRARSAESSAAMGAMPMGTMGAMPMRGMTAPGMAMDLNDVAYDAFLTNDRTLHDPEVIRAARSSRLRLRIINGACSSAFWIDLGGLAGKLIAVDGHRIVPVAGTRFPIAMAQRLDILIDLPPDAGAWLVGAQLQGSRQRTGVIVATPDAAVARVSTMADTPAPPIDHSLEVRLKALAPLAPRAPDARHRVVLSGSMKPYAWALNGQHWPDITPLMVRAGQRVEIDLVNTSMMAHPIHLHGHSFQVIALNGRPVNGAVRDVVLVQAMGSARIAFDADNPGRWPLHCHNLYHMMTGMMTEVRYDNIII